MCASIIQVIARIKRNVAQFLTAASIVQACRDVQYTWREREIGPAQMVWAFLLQVLHEDTACLDVVRLAQLSWSGSADCIESNNGSWNLFYAFFRIAAPGRDMAGESRNR